DPARRPGDRKKNAVVAQRVRAVTPYAMTTICSVLGIARRTAYYRARTRPGGRYHRADDGDRAPTDPRGDEQPATYGYRRVWAMVNRTCRVGYNRKRIRRVMQLHGLMLAPRVHRRHGRPARRPDLAAGLQSALVLGRVLDSVLERRGGLGSLRH